jgi:hypothetical protein
MMMMLMTIPRIAARRTPNPPETEKEKFLPK